MLHNARPGAQRQPDRKSQKNGYTVKKGYRFSRPQAGYHRPNSPWPGIIKFFPARESLVSDTPLGWTGKSITFFYSVGCRKGSSNFLVLGVGCIM